MKEIYMCDICSKKFMIKDDCLEHELLCKPKEKPKKEIDPNILEHERKYKEITEVVSDSGINLLVCTPQEGNIDTYKIVKRKAKQGDLVYLVKSNGNEPFHELYLNKIFYVTTDEIINEWVKPHVNVGYFALYHDQYVVLEKINN